MDSKMAPKLAQKVVWNFWSPKWLQNGVKMLLKMDPTLPGTFVAQDGAKMAPRCCKMVSRLD